MSSLSPSLMGPEDWVAFAFRYWLDLAALLASMALLLLARCLFGGNKITPVYFAGALALVAGACVLHVGLTAKRSFILTMLGAEDDRVAEVAYRELARDAQLHDLICLVHSGREGENIRFYAACLIADRLNTNEAVNVASVLHGIEGAPSICPRFFATNSINYFLSPSRGPVTPHSLVAERLKKEKKGVGRERRYL